jgi:peptide/nickel transport system permease protein
VTIRRVVLRRLWRWSVDPGAGSRATRELRFPAGWSAVRLGGRPAAASFVFLLVRPPRDPPVHDRAIPVNPAAARFGLDQPLSAQLGAFTAGLTRGELGVSIEHYPERVTSLLARRLPATLLLGATVLLLNFTLGIWLGVLQARRRGSAIDRCLTRASLAGYAMPSFCLIVLVAF